jgi:hypothetical protein
LTRNTFSGPTRLCFLGPPGAGKTSILKYAQDTLRDKNWLCGYSQASPDASTAIDEFLEDARQVLPRGGVGQKFLSRLTEISVSFGGIGAGVKVAESRERPTYARVREMFQTLGDVAKKTNTGVALLIDEAQALPDRDLDLLVRVLDNLYSYPVAVILAGLPGIPAKLSKDETTGADTLIVPSPSPE